MRPAGHAPHFEQRHPRFIKRQNRYFGSGSSFKAQSEYKTDLLCTYDPVVNDEELCLQLKKVSQALGLDYRESGIFMTGEDFGFFTSLYPSLLFWLGAGESASDLHSDKFLPDEKCIQTGIDVFLKLMEQG